MILNTLVLGNVNSSAELDMFSKPMKAHGDMQAMRIICDKELLSGIKMGSKPVPEEP